MGVSRMKLEEMTFTVVVIDGHWTTQDQYDQDSLHYEGLSWQEASELVRLSFLQGYEAVIWRMEDE